MNEKIIDDFIILIDGMKRIEENESNESRWQQQEKEKSHVNIEFYEWDVKSIV